MLICGKEKVQISEMFNILAIYHLGGLFGIVFMHTIAIIFGFYNSSRNLAKG